MNIVGRPLIFDLSFVRQKVFLYGLCSVGDYR